MGPPSSYKSEIAQILEQTQNWKHFNAQEYIKTQMTDQECVSAVIDNIIRLQNKHGRFLVEHFPNNLMQAKLFTAQLISPIRCIQTSCSFSQIQQVESQKTERRTGAELIRLERD